MKNTISHEEAEGLAIEALGFIAADNALLERFMDITGIIAGDIRQAAQGQGFLAGILSFLLNHEPTLLEFCQAAQHAPETIERAFAVLPGGNVIEH